VSFRFSLFLALLFGVLVAYLASLNHSEVRVTLGGGVAYELPLMAVVLGAFFLGATLGCVLGTFRDLGRAYRDYHRNRRARRVETVAEIYQHGVESQLAGRSDEAIQAYEDVRRRDPAHAGAPIRLAELARQRGNALAALDHDLEALRAEERVETLLAAARDYETLGRADDAVRMYERVLARDRDHLVALRGLRDVAAEHQRWGEAVSAQERLVRVAPRDERTAEDAWLAGAQYEMGRALLAGGDVQGAASRFRDALRTRPDFQPAAVALGDAHVMAGDTREALRVWERALEKQPTAPLLSRLEHIYRRDGRPAKLLSIYRETEARCTENLEVAFGLGRVYFELAMLDEAAEQFQKLEVRAPDLPGIHAYLGAIFERHGQAREAFEAYRRALRFPEGFEWRHRCVACGATQPSWFDRCPSCRCWNTSRA
jgi:lipopolysaccharide biosynthesis regulator YciM